MNKAAHAYFKTNVSTTDQGHLLIMLYDGALKFLQQAREKIIAKDFAAKGILISKVIDIVTELSGSLNMEKGGSLATNLNNLYLLCTARLLQANLKMDLNALDSVVKILEGLRSAYAEILNRPEAQNAVQQIASRIQPMASTSKRAQPIMQTQTAPIAGNQVRNAYSRMMQSAQAAPAPQSLAPKAESSLSPDPLGMQNFVSQQGYAAQRMRAYGQV
ncbi:MAG: flagellar export chaperone FliS [Desulfovibrio sp.]|nr:flagellar export chaperone FliS [Desulfovibrio sp.]